MDKPTLFKTLNSNHKLVNLAFYNNPEFIRKINMLLLDICSTDELKIDGISNIFISKLFPLKMCMYHIYTDQNNNSQNQQSERVAYAFSFHPH